MKSTKKQVVELETELLRLNDMVRARRQQLAKLEQCPHKDCECRAVWRQIVEKDLAGQVGRIRGKIGNPTSGSRKNSQKPKRKQNSSRRRQRSRL